MLKKTDMTGPLTNAARAILRALVRRPGCTMAQAIDRAGIAPGDAWRPVALLVWGGLAGPLHGTDRADGPWGPTRTLSGAIHPRVWRYLD